MAQRIRILNNCLSFLTSNRVCMCACLCFGSVSFVSFIHSVFSRFTFMRAIHIYQQRKKAIKLVVTIFFCVTHTEHSRNSVIVHHNPSYCKEKYYRGQWVALWARFAVWIRKSFEMAHRVKNKKKTNMAVNFWLIPGSLSTTIMTMK